LVSIASLYFPPQGAGNYTQIIIKALIGSGNRYRIRIGDYRVGIEINGDTLELFRVLHRKEFYRYFP
jgi:mRNA-degrading endonuclease RelE of RelBE toxin-antitoxin system